jgi:hypothetical protein
VTFEYVADGDALPKPKFVYTGTDLGIAVPMIFEFLSKIPFPMDSVAMVAIQFKLDANDDESDQEVRFLQRFQTTDRVAYKLLDGSLFHHVTDRKTTPLDRIAYIVKVQ